MSAYRRNGWQGREAAHGRSRPVEGNDDLTLAARSKLGYDTSAPSRHYRQRLGGVRSQGQRQLVSSESAPRRATAARGPSLAAMKFGCRRSDVPRHAEGSQFRSNPLGADLGIVERPDRDAVRMVSRRSSTTEERELRFHLVPTTRHGYRRADSRSRHFARSNDPYHLGKSMSMVDPEALPDRVVEPSGVDGDDVLGFRHARVHDAAHAIAESRAVLCGSVGRLIALDLISHQVTQKRPASALCRRSDWEWHDRARVTPSTGRARHHGAMAHAAKGKVG